MCNSCKPSPIKLDNINSLIRGMEKLGKGNKDKALLLKNSSDDLKKKFFTDKGLDRFINCGNMMGFQAFYDTSNGKVLNKVVCNNCCKNPLCYECNRKKIYKKRMTLLSAIQSKGIDKLHCYFLVLTVQHDEIDSVEEVYKKLTKSKTKLRDMMNNAKSGKGRHTVFSCVEGAYWAIEVTNENGNGWHIHLNYILFTNKEIDLTVVYGKNNKPIKRNNGKILTISREMRDEWLSITGDTFITSMEKVDISTTEKLEKSLGELIKYCLKDDKLTPDEKLQFGIATKGKRMNGGRGSLYNLKEVENDDDIDDIDLDNLLVDELKNDGKEDIEQKEKPKAIDWNSGSLVKIGSGYYTAKFDGYNNYFARSRIIYTAEGIQLGINLEDVIPIKYLITNDGCVDYYE